MIPGEYVTELPGWSTKPQKSLHRFSYYIDVTDKAFHASRTAEFVPEVASGPAACGREKVLAAGLTKANVLVHAPEGVAGAPAFPAGFAADGVVTAGTGTVAGTTAATAGGIGAKAVILGTVLAAGGAGAVVATTSGGDGDSPSPPPTTLPPPTATGRWSGTLFENDPVGQCTANWNIAMDLVESGGSLTGSMTLTGVSGTTGIYQCAFGLVFGPNPLSDGAIVGTAVRWSFLFFYQSTAVTWNFDGVIAADRRSMSGTWNQPDRPGEGGTWTATRQ